MLKKTLCFIALFAVLVSGCGGNKTQADTPWELPKGEGSRDNTPLCLVPEAAGKDVLKNDTVTIDCSNASEGYVIARYTGTNDKVKFQITGGDKVTYTYNMATGGGREEVFPLSAGDGKYSLGVYENIRVNEYATAFAADINVDLRDEYLPFLYPNQYVLFDEESKAVDKGKELAAPANSDLDVISNVYNYIIRNVSYDIEKANSVQSGYIPDIDEILDSGKGICLDYAALMTAMLRSQQIPTRLEVGYAGTAYHAWLSSYIENVGWINGIIQFDGVHWEMMDPTFAASTGESELKQFIGEGDNYVLKYVY